MNPSPDPSPERAFAPPLRPAVATFDLDGRVTGWTAGAESLFGWSPLEAHGRRIEDLLSDTRSAGAEWSGRAVIRRRDGSAVSVLATVTPLVDADGAQLATSMACVALSDLAEMDPPLAAERDARAAAEAMRDDLVGLLAAITDGVIAVDDRWVVTLLNRAAEDYYREAAGLTRGQIVGRRLWDVFPEVAATPFGETYERVMRDRVAEVIEGFYAPFDRWYEVRTFPRDPGIVIVFQEITARKRAEAELRRSLHQLRIIDRDRRNLIARIVGATEHERRRIARDIHDDSIQVMAGVSIKLEALERSIPPEVRPAVDDVKRTVRDAIAGLRTLVFDLRPISLEEEGLVPTLQLQLDRLSEETGVEYEIVDRLGDEPPLESRFVLYRVAREALTNVRKHARATLVTVSVVGADDGYRMSIVDNGIGFDPSATPTQSDGHIGLFSMHHDIETLGGWCRVRSVPGEGTTVEFFVPPLGASDFAVRPDSRARARS